ncbi:DinB family protein [bacterium]|nr:DinB family protein [bacterium]
MTKKDFEIAFAINQDQLKLYLRDFTAELASRYPDGGGNPVNWILGHILAERVEAIESTNFKADVGFPDLSMYVTGSKPDPNVAKPFEELVKLIDSTHDQLMKLIDSMEENELTVPQERTMLGRSCDFGQLFLAYPIHEMYHIGQISMLRRNFGLPGLW